MIKGVDYSTRPADWGKFFETLKGKGYTVIGRYLYDYDDPKRLTREELDAAFAAGISVFCWFETSEGAALDGYKRGVAHAERALSELRVLGLPEDLPVYLCVDFDATDSQLAGPVRKYFEGARTILPHEQMGAYGGWRSVRYLADAGLVRYTAQTEAWSYLNGYWPKQPVWHPGACMHQWTVHGPGKIGGVQCDGLDIVADCGAYHPDQGDDMDASIIELIKQNRLSHVARSYDVEIIRAEIKGDTERVAKLEADKLQDLEDVRKALGLD